MAIEGTDYLDDGRPLYLMTYRYAYRRIMNEAPKATSHRVYAVYQCIIDHASNGDERTHERTGSFPSYKRIAEEANVSRSTAIECVKILVSLNLLTVTARHTNDGDVTSNLYTITYEAEGSPVSGLGVPVSELPRPLSVSPQSAESTHLVRIPDPTYIPEPDPSIREQEPPSISSVDKPDPFGLERPRLERLGIHSLADYAKLTHRNFPPGDPAYGVLLAEEAARKQGREGV